VEGISLASSCRSRSRTSHPRRGSWRRRKLHRSAVACGSRYSSRTRPIGTRRRSRTDRPGARCRRRLRSRGRIGGKDRRTVDGRRMARRDFGPGERATSARSAAIRSRPNRSSCSPCRCRVVARTERQREADPHILRSRSRPNPGRNTRSHTPRGSRTHRQPTRGRSAPLRTPRRIRRPGRSDFRRRSPRRSRGTRPLGRGRT
jgi:hypothetical protein